MGFKEFKNNVTSAIEQGDKIEYFNLKGRVSGNVLTTSQKNIPSPAYTYNVDVTKLWDEFQKLKKNCDYKLSFNTLMMRVMVEGLKVAPRLNAHLEYNSTSSCGRLIVKKHIDIAMPVHLETGETFPVKVRHTEDKTLKELSDQIANLLQRLENTDLNKVLFNIIKKRTIGFVLQGKLKTTLAQTVTGYVGKYKVAKLAGLVKPNDIPADWLQENELNEGTTCFTNWGALSKDLRGEVTYAPLLAPQVFMLVMGNIRDEEYAYKNEDNVVDIATRKVLPLNLMFDHRIGGFADIVPFIKRIDEIFENPEVIHNW